MGKNLAGVMPTAIATALVEVGQAGGQPRPTSLHTQQAQPDPAYYVADATAALRAVVSGERRAARPAAQALRGSSTRRIELPARVVSMLKAWASRAAPTCAIYSTSAGAAS